jgi:hypothetical protein
VVLTLVAKLLVFFFVVIPLIPPFIFVFPQYKNTIDLLEPLYINTSIFLGELGELGEIDIGDIKVKKKRL